MNRLIWYCECLCKYQCQIQYVNIKYVNQKKILLCRSVKSWRHLFIVFASMPNLYCLCTSPMEMYCKSLLQIPPTGHSTHPTVRRKLLNWDSLFMWMCTFSKVRMEILCSCWTTAGPHPPKTQMTRWDGTCSLNGHRRTLLISLNTWRIESLKLSLCPVIIVGVLLVGIARMGLFCCRLGLATRRWGTRRITSDLRPGSSHLWMCLQGWKDWYVTRNNFPPTTSCRIWVCGAICHSSKLKMKTFLQVYFHCDIELCKGQDCSQCNNSEWVYTCI